MPTSSSSYKETLNKQQMDKIENDMAEAKLLNTQLRKEAEKKILTLSQLDEDIARENESYILNAQQIKQISNDDYEEYKSKYDDLLYQKQNKLMLLTNYETTLYENYNLQNKYEALTIELIQLKEQIRLTYDDKKQRIFDEKILLENVRKEMINQYSIQSKDELVRTT